MIFLVLLTNFIVVAGAGAVNCCLRCDFKLFFYKIMSFSAQLVSAQKIVGFFSFRKFVALLLI